MESHSLTPWKKGPVESNQSISILNINDHSMSSYPQTILQKRWFLKTKKKEPLGSGVIEQSKTATKVDWKQSLNLTVHS